MNVTRYKCSILVVDDDPAVLSMLVEQLGSEFDVLTATAAGPAREVLARRSVDMVLTDLNLPDESGLSLLDWVRKTTPRTSRVLITGTARLEDAADAINQTQVHRLVLKPWRAADLLQSLRAACRALLMERSHEQLLDELRRLNTDLEERVAERTRELEIALGQLQHKTMFLEKMALTDPLTGLPNRRAIELIARKEMNRRRRTPAPITLAMIDLDLFKQFNDTFTLAGGDHALQLLAETLQNLLRATDSLGRWAGDEFLVIAPETDAEGAAALAERLRAGVEASETHFESKPMRMTITIGLAVTDADVVASYDEVVKCAMLAIKDAKASGRNRAVIHEFTGPAAK